MNIELNYKNLLIPFAILLPLIIPLLIYGKVSIGLVGFIGLIIFLVIFQNYRIGLIFLIIALPLFQSVSVHSDSATSTGINFQYIFIPLITLSWLCKMIWQKQLHQLHFPNMSILFWMLFAFCGSILLQSDNSPREIIIQGYIQIFALSVYIILFYIIVNESFSERETNFIFTGIFFVAFIASIIGIYQFFHTRTNISNVHRVTSIFGSIFRNDTKDNPNAFGTYLALILSSSIWYFQYISKKKLFFIAIATIVMFTALLFSFSRSALLAFIVSFLCFSYFKNKKIFILSVVLCASGILFLYFQPIFNRRFQSIIILLTNSQVLELFKRIDLKAINNEYINYFGIGGFNSDVISGAFRLRAWIMGVQLFIEKPILGVGYHQTLGYSTFPTAENLLLDILSMTGIIGTSFFLIWIYKLTRSAFRNQRLKFKYNWGFLQLLLLVVCFTVSTTGSILFDGKLMGICFIFMGLCNNHNYLHLQEKKK